MRTIQVSTLTINNVVITIWDGHNIVESLVLSFEEAEDLLKELEKVVKSVKEIKKA